MKTSCVMSRVVVLFAIAPFFVTDGRTAELSRATSKEEASSAKANEDAVEKDEIESVLEGHSYHGEAFNEGPRQAAYIMGNTGDVHFPVKSHNRLVQQFIDQGIGQLHGFWYLEAERSFRQAAALDSNCAAAYWGMAMANKNNKERAKKFSAEAVKRRDHETKRVQRYIDALDKKLNTKDKKKAFENYVKDLEKIVYDYPSDIEAKAFIVLELWLGRSSGVKINSHLAVDALAKEVLAANPLHPIHHYRIHLWDYEKPERALDSAARCGQSAPGIAHMWHMPGHIYSRLKRYEDAAWQQEASARTDHAHMMRDQLLPDQIHNFAHNNEWLISNLIFVGRIHDALDLAKNMIELPRHPKYNTLSKRNCSSYYGRQRLFQVLSRGELWEELLQLTNSPYLPPTDDFADQIKRLRHIGRAHGWLGQLEACAGIRAELQTLYDKLNAEKDTKKTEAEQQAAEKFDEQKKPDPKSPESETDAPVAATDAKSSKEADAEETSKEQKTDKKPDDAIRRAGKKIADEYDRKLRRIKRAIDEMDAYAALQSEDKKKAIELFDSAGEIEKWHRARFRHLAGETKEAIEDLQSYADKQRGEALPLAYLAEICWQAGEKEKARRAFEKLRDISASIDLQAPPFRRLKPIAKELGYSGDWRKSNTTRDDVGDRPPLDELGPFRWQPPVASDWLLEAADGQIVSLDQFKGRPVVVIFYLGFGCLHCAEQIQAFAPRVDDFRKAGIEIVAISSDGKEKLKDSVESFGGVFPIRLLSDGELDVFKAYRVYDDFENQPLHGTFLIDGEKRIRWHDVSFEPFMDHEFVLEEAKRLLAISPD